MKLRFLLLIFSFLFLLNSAPVSAQSIFPLIGKPDTERKILFGFVYGLGIGQIKLTDLNTRLQALQIGRLDEILFNAQMGITLERPDGFGSYLEGTWGISLENQGFAENSRLSFDIASLEIGYQFPVIYTNRLGTWFTTGLQKSNMNFRYDYDTTAEMSFDETLTNPAANFNALSLVSSSNYLASLGLKSQYRFRSKEKDSPIECRLGFNSEYSLNLKNSSWREDGGLKAVKNIPAVKPSNFNINLTFALLFTSDFFKPKTKASPNN